MTFDRRTRFSYVYSASAILLLSFMFHQSRAHDVLDTFSSACGTDGQDVACGRTCATLVRTGKIGDLPIVAQTACQSAIAQYAVQRAKARPCGGDTCLHELKPQALTNKRGDNVDRYAGDDYAATLRYKWTDKGTWIYASIDSGGGQVSRFRTFCSGDGLCGKWEYRSGPIRKATIWIPSYHDPMKSIAIELPRRGSPQ